MRLTARRDAQSRSGDQNDLVNVVVRVDKRARSTYPHRQSYIYNSDDRFESARFPRLVDNDRYGDKYRTRYIDFPLADIRPGLLSYIYPHALASFAVLELCYVNICVWLKMVSCP